MDLMKTEMTANGVGQLAVAGARTRSALGLGVETVSTRSSYTWAHIADWAATHKPFPRRLKEPPQ